MTCTAIDHTIAGTIPVSLCRHCHPEYNNTPWVAGPTAAPVVTPAQDFRSRYPLTEQDRITIELLEAREKATAKAKTMDRITALKAKIAERSAGTPKEPVQEADPEIELDDKPVVLHRKPGIISCVVELMSRPEGASQAEIHAELVKRFPDREAAGMLKTCKIQSRKLCTSVEENPKRGLVFKAVVEG